LANERELAVAVDDPPAREVVGGELDLDPIAGKDSDSVAPHLAGGVSDRLVPVVKLNPIHAAAKGLYDFALEFDLLLFIRDDALLPFLR
jgi:hypothetical protein